MKERKKKLLQYTRPIWYNYFRVKRSYGISWTAALRVASISFLFLFANGWLQSAVVDKSDPFFIYIKIASVLSIAPFYRRIEVHGQKLGLIILVLFGALGYTVGTQIF